MTDVLMFVGSCTSKLGYVAAPAGKGISVFRVNPDTGSATLVSETTGVENPTFVALSPNGRTLVAGSELAGQVEGQASAYAIDGAALTLRSRLGTRGFTPAHVGFDRTGQYVAVANYGDAPASAGGAAVVVARLAADGGFAAVTGVAEHAGATGPDSGRQDRSHAHCVRFSPDNRFLVVSDLGLDRLVVHRFDATSGAIAPHGEAELAPGAGPRHFVFHPNGRQAYVVNELNSTVTSLAFAADSGRFTVLGDSTTLPDGWSGVNYPSAIAIDASGKLVLAANRGHDSLALLAVGDDGVARLAGTTPSGGRVPRDFALGPDGRLLAVANQESDRIDFFRVEGMSLTQFDHVATGSPTAIAFTAT